MSGEMVNDVRMIGGAKFDTKDIKSVKQENGKNIVIFNNGLELTFPNQKGDVNFHTIPWIIITDKSITLYS